MMIPRYNHFSTSDQCTFNKLVIVRIIRYDMKITRNIYLLRHPTQVIENSTDVVFSKFESSTQFSG